MLIKNTEYTIAKLGLFSGLLGYTLSFHRVYLFHFVMVLLVIYIFLFKKNIGVRTLKIVFPVIIFFLFSALTLVWTKNIEFGLINLFYVFCGLFAVIFSVLCTSDQYKLKNTYKFIVIVFFINCLIGVLEIVGVFRLPMSPYSEYASFFGYKASDLNEFYSYQVESILNKPTGFHWNPNNFGFVFILTFPFLFFYNNFTKYSSLFFLIFFNFYLQSRGMFLATILFFIVYFIVNFKEKFLYFIFFSLIALIMFPFFNYDLDINRLESTFESIKFGIDNILNNNVNLYSNSTDIRSSIYALGIMHLLLNPILGLGLGGIQTELINMNSPIQSFHFYFLEILVNYGILFYVIFIVFYVGLIFKLFKLSIKIENVGHKKIILSVFYALTIMPFASIAPSSIVYILTAWIVVGLALSIVFLGKEGCFNEK